jgi:uncharacterized coiled-coil protein SlyX
MDLLQGQVSALNTKVDALHEMLKHVEHQVAEMASVLKRSESNLFASKSELPVRQTYYAYHNQQLLEGELDHKDILSDVAYSESDSHAGDRGITPEIQIQRLTAQLTAAYNRIAALEEQLIAKRLA